MAEDTRKFTEIHRVVVYDWMAARLKLKDTQIYVYAAFHTAGSHGIPSVASAIESVSAILGIGKSTFYRVRDELCGMKLLGYTESPLGPVYYTREHLPDGGKFREKKSSAYAEESVPDETDEAPEAERDAPRVLKGVANSPSYECFAVAEAEDTGTSADGRSPDGDPMEALDGAVRLLEGGIRGLRVAGERMCVRVEKFAEEGKETRRRLKALSGKAEEKKHGRKHGGRA